MKSIILWLFSVFILVIVFQGHQMSYCKDNEYGATMHISDKQGSEDFYNREIKMLTSTHLLLHQKHLRIEEGDKENKNNNKRTVVTNNNCFFPYGLKISDINEPTIINYIRIPTDSSQKFDNVPSISTKPIVHKKFIGVCTVLKVYLLNLVENKTQERKGGISISYTNSQYLARRMLTRRLTEHKSKIPNPTEFTYPKDIGDDYCFMNKDDSRSCIYFIRDYTVFSIQLDHAKDIDIEELARYIDKRFVELNEELNKLEESDKNPDQAPPNSNGK